jgi:hypothetical protein
MRRKNELQLARNTITNAGFRIWKQRSAMQRKENADVVTDIHAQAWIRKAGTQKAGDMK